MKVNLTGGAYKTRSAVMNAETMINLFPDMRLGGEDFALVGTPGTQLLKDIFASNAITGEIRGLSYDGNNLWIVCGDKLLHLDNSTFVVTNVSGSTTITGSGPVSIANNGIDNGKEVVIATGSTAYIYSWDGGFDSGFSTGFDLGGGPLTGNLAPYTTPVTANTVTWMDGRFVLDDQTVRGRFYYSDLYDGETVNELSFATAEGSPDALVAVKADRRQLYLFGEKTTEIWYTTTDPDRPYARFQGGFIQTGCAAPLSVARFDNSLVWLAQDELGYGTVVRLGNNYAVEVISPPGINYQISTYSDISDAFAFTIRWDGHEWYVLTFPTVAVTWVFDSVSGQWFNWRFGANNRHMANCAAAIPVGGLIASPLILIGDYRGGNTATRLYYLQNTRYKDYVDGGAGDIAIQRERATQHINAENDRVRISRLQLDCLEGAAGSLTLEYSKDGGLNYGTARSTTTGAATGNRVIWRQLGHARNWVFRLKTSMSEGPVIWLNLWAKLWGEPNR